MFRFKQNRYFFFFLFFLFFTPSLAFAAQTLHSARKEITQYAEGQGRERKVITQMSFHHYLRFEENDGFEFVLSDNHVSVKNHPFFDKGTTLFIYYPDDLEEVPIPYRLSNRVVMVRNGMVAAKNYFDREGEKAGLPTKWWKPEEPIMVLFGKPTGAKAAAEAGFWEHRIVVGPTVANDLHALAIHEYFHLHYDAIWYNGDPNDFWHRYGSPQSKDPFHTYLIESTAQWATDEPIEVEKVTYGTRAMDDFNDYAKGAGLFLSKNHQPFFTRGEYDSSAFIKYLAEQMAGDKDESVAPEMLKLIHNAYMKGGVDGTHYFDAIIEALPPELQTGDPAKTWKQFYTNFAASSVVQSAKSRKKPDSRLGYHDESFNEIDRWHYNTITDKWFEDSSNWPEKIYETPAQSDEERRERLRTLAQMDEEIPAMAYLLHEIDLGGRQRGRAKARPVYLLARGSEHANVFALHQEFPDGDYKADRKAARFDRNLEFDFANSTGDSPEAYGVIRDVDYRTHKQLVWVGLVNTDRAQAKSTASWVYLAAPRFAPFEAPQRGRTSDTIHLTNSGMDYRSPEEGVFNGDDFAFEFQTTGPIHRNGANDDNLKPEDIAFEFKILNDLDQEVELKEDFYEGRKLRIRQTRKFRKYQEYTRYKVYGQIDDRNPHVGDCRFYLKITSPLNLGDEDEDIDETLKFKLSPIRPAVNRFEVTLGDELIYDNVERIRRIPEDKEGDYKLKIKTTFSLPMRQGRVEINAGMEAPYERYPVTRIKCREDDKVCTGEVTIPKAEISAGGNLVRFSIRGQSKKFGNLDADFSKPEDQPNIAHFIVLGVKEYYELELSAKTHQSVTSQDYMDIFGDLGPIDLKVRLVPYILNHQGRNNVYVEHFEGILDRMTKVMADLKAFIPDLEEDYKRFKKNPKRAAKELLKKKEKDLAMMKKGLKMGGGLFGAEKLPPNYKEMAGKRIEQMENYIKERKRNRNFHEELLADKERDLQMQKKRLDFFEKRAFPLWEATVRLMNGYKTFRHKAGFGDIPIQFRGLRIDWHSSSGPGAASYAEAAGSGREVNYTYGRVRGQGWGHSDIGELDSELAEDWGYPNLHTWDFWPSDIEKANTLMGMAGSYPDYMMERFIPHPQGESVLDPQLMRLYGMQENVRTVMKVMNRLLLDLTRKMWEFFPEEDRPDLSDETAIEVDEDGYGAAKPSVLRLPVPQTSRLVALSGHYVSGLGIYMPIQSEGFEHQIWYRPDYIDYMGIAGHVEEDVTEEEELYLHEVKRNYEKGGERRKDARFTARFDWIGTSPGPQLIGRLPVPHQLRYGESGFWLGNHGGIDWNMLDANCAQDFEVNKHRYFTFFAHPDDKMVHGTFQGKHHRYEEGNGSHFNYDFTTHWRLERTGDDVLPDPAEALPDWDGEVTPLPEVPADPEPEAPEPTDTFASSYDPDTGITTESRRNTDGSRTVTQTDKDGNVISEETMPPSGTGLPSASSTDPSTGITTTSQGNPDGSRTITQVDSSGNVLSETTIGP